ncbi:MAG TPA: 50S ribosomal protein L32 [Deltaproteobacteria bacterium]|nr:50S ribosomal protein L32 [Deltaproteobacteria bacterium]
MPTPRKKKSRSKRNMRRSHDALAAPAASTCPRCGEPKRPHHACPACGTYRGREVLRTGETV